MNGLKLSGPQAPRRDVLDLLSVCMLALLGSTIWFTSRVTVPPAPRTVGVVASIPVPVPCGPLQVVSAVRLRHAIASFYCGITPSQKSQILESLDYALQAMPPGTDPSLQLFAFVDEEQGARAEYQWLKAAGYTGLDYTEIKDGWEDFIGRALPGAVFILADPDRDMDGRSAMLPLTVLHEMHHVLQDELWPAHDPLPAWLAEGGAEAFAYRQLSDLGFSEWSVRRQPNAACDRPLGKIFYDDRVLPTSCVYIEGERAVSLLLDEYGPERYYLLFRRFRPGYSFDRVFRQVYDMPLAQFYRLFDEYRQSGYSDAPRLIPPGSALMRSAPQ